MADPKIISDSNGGAAEFQLTTRDKVFTLVGTLLGLLLAALDQTIVATAGPAIQRDLEVSAVLYPWITTAYLVASTVMVPVYGKLSDTYGRKPILLTGIGIFLTGSLGCGVSGSPFTLIAARAVQGLGSAALFTSAFAVIADIFAPAERGKYQGIFAGCFAVSSVVGPLLGGFLTDAFSWHWVFFVNLPLGVVAVTFIMFRMPLLRRPQARRVRVDYLGAFWLLLTVVPLMIGLSLTRQGQADPKARMILIAFLGVSAVALVLFVVTERRVKEPLLDLRLFKNRVFAIGNLATFLLGATFLAAIVFLPLFMVNVIGLSATSAGLTLMPLTFGIVGGNVLSGQLVARIGRYKPLLLLGNLILLTGFVLLGFTLSPDSSQTELTLKMVTLGLGLGPSMPLFTLAIQNAVAPENIGVATASAMFFRQIGATIGVSTLGLVFALTLNAAVASVERPGLPTLSTGAGMENAAAPHESAITEMRVDVAGHRAAIQAQYSDPEEKRRALEALERWDRDTKSAFTSAIESIYRWGLIIAVLGMFVTLWLPELPLRKAAAPAAE